MQYKLSKSVPGQASQPSQSKSSKKLSVRRPNAPFVPPSPTTRLKASITVVGPTTRRTTPTKRAAPKWKL